MGTASSRPTLGSESPKFAELPAPERFRNLDLQINNGQPGALKDVCLPLSLKACIQVAIEARASYQDLRARVESQELQRLVLKTRLPAPGANDPLPSHVQDADDTDRFLWNTVPLLGIRFEGAPGGSTTVSFSGKDDPDDENFLNQKAACCTFRSGPFSYTSQFDPTLFQNDVDIDGKDLHLQFYGWEVQQDAPGHVSKFNRSGEHLDRGPLSYLHAAGWTLDDVPFSPTFIADGTPNGFHVASGATAYFVPNPFDLLFSTAKVGAPDERERLSFSRQGELQNFAQTDWPFQMLLNEMETDLLDLGTP